MATATRKRSNNRTRRNGSKPTPDLMSTLKRGPGRPPKPAPTASQIADEIEEHIKNLRAVVAILRGEV
jgi:hypothetical protein